MSERERLESKIESSIKRLAKLTRRKGGPRPKWRAVRKAAKSARRAGQKLVKLQKKQKKLRRGDRATEQPCASVPMYTAQLEGDANDKPLSDQEDDQRSIESKSGCKLKPSSKVRKKKHKRMKNATKMALLMACAPGKKKGKSSKKLRKVMNKAALRHLGEKASVKKRKKKKKHPGSEACGKRRKKLIKRSGQ